MAQPIRYQQAISTSREFSSICFVECPRCDDCAVIRSGIFERTDSEEAYEHLHRPIKQPSGGDQELQPVDFRCLRCGLYHDFVDFEQLNLIGLVNWFVETPLWLQVECDDGWAWAMNDSHLDAIEETLEQNEWDELVEREELPAGLAHCSDPEKAEEHVEKLTEKLEGLKSRLVVRKSSPNKESTRSNSAMARPSS